MPRRRDSDGKSIESLISLSSDPNLSKGGEYRYAKQAREAEFAELVSFVKLSKQPFGTMWLIGEVIRKGSVN